MVRKCLFAIGLALAALAGAARAAEGPDFSAVRAERDAVVSVIVSHGGREGEPPGSLLEELARSYDYPFELEGRAFGSGVVTTEDGFIVTSAHLIDGPEPEIVVRLADRREFEARIVGVDLETDVALIKIEASRLRAARLGDPARLEIGEWVAALGSPFGLEHSLTAGVVSAKARWFPEEAYVPFIQTDVAVNPGSSGGALFNLRGEVVGLNSLIFSQSGGYMGLAFAIPIDFVTEVAAELHVHGRVVRGALGVRLQDLSLELAQALGLARPEGALVSDVRGSSGLKPGDVVLVFDGKPVNDCADLLRLAAHARPGSTVEVALVRARAWTTLPVKIGVKQQAAGASPGPATALADPLGLELAPLGPAARKRLGVQGGLVVKQAAGAGFRAGLRRGDILLSVEGKALHSAADLYEHLKAEAAGRYHALYVQRGPSRLFVALRLPG